MNNLVLIKGKIIGNCVSLTPLYKHYYILLKFTSHLVLIFKSNNA